MAHLPLARSLLFSVPLSRSRALSVPTPSVQHPPRLPHRQHPHPMPEGPHTRRHMLTHTRRRARLHRWLACPVVLGLVSSRRFAAPYFASSSSPDLSAMRVVIPGRCWLVTTDGGGSTRGRGRAYEAQLADLVLARFALSASPFSLALPRYPLHPLTLALSLPSARSSFRVVPSFLMSVGWPPPSLRPSARTRWTRPPRTRFAAPAASASWRTRPTRSTSSARAASTRWTRGSRTSTRRGTPMKRRRGRPTTHRRRRRRAHHRRVGPRRTRTTPRRRTTRP